ncbi:hypothetical protein KA012_02460 [Candidatus Woesebacteria bacterium]|nr:hypothetical protein [Candidatus Woesebacteria bacterium]
MPETPGYDPTKENSTPGVDTSSSAATHIDDATTAVEALEYQEPFQLVAGDKNDLADGALDRAQYGNREEIEDAVELGQMMQGRPAFEKAVRENALGRAQRAIKSGSAFAPFIESSSRQLALLKAAGMSQQELGKYEISLCNIIINGTGERGTVQFLEDVTRVGFTDKQILDAACLMLATRGIFDQSQYGEHDLRLIADRLNLPIERVQQEVAIKITDVDKVGEKFLGVGFKISDETNMLAPLIRKAERYGIPFAISRVHFKRLVDTIVDETVPTYFRRRLMTPRNPLIERMKKGFINIQAKHPDFALLAQRVIDALDAQRLTSVPAASATSA